MDCLKDHLEDCPTQHRTAIQNVRSKWTQFISTCALTLPFQDDDSSERLRDEQTRNDEVRSQLNGMVSLSQSNINQYVGTQRTAGDQVLGNLAADKIAEGLEKMRENVNNLMEKSDNLQDFVGTVRDIIIPKINNVQPIIQQLSDKRKAKVDDDRDDSKVEDEDDNETNDGKSRKSAILPDDTVSVEVLSTIVDFLNDHLSADDGEIKTDLADDSTEDNQEGELQIFIFHV